MENISPNYSSLFQLLIKVNSVFDNFPIFLSNDHNFNLINDQKENLFGIVNFDTLIIFVKGKRTRNSGHPNKEQWTLNTG